MSHRVTTRTDIKDKTVAVQALKKAGWGHHPEGDTGISVTTGPMAGAFIDLRTGIVSGDTDDRLNEKKLGALKKFYAEAVFLREAQRQGHQVESRTVMKDRIRLIVQSG